jgi:Tfp pilus assembly protein PilN
VLAYLASLAAACPRLALPANLLPSAERTSSSRLIYAPTLALGAILIAGLAALGVHTRWEDAKYLALLQSETARLENPARLVSQLEQHSIATRARIDLLDRFAVRTQTDLDALREATRLIPPPAWLNTLELTRTSLVVAGEADQASGLLKAIDSSQQFRNSEFLIPISRVGTAEVFRIRSAREGAGQ